MFGLLLTDPRLPLHPLLSFAIWISFQNNIPRTIPQRIPEKCPNPRLLLQENNTRHHHHNFANMFNNILL